MFKPLKQSLFWLQRLDSNQILWRYERQILTKARCYLVDGAAGVGVATPFSAGLCSFVGFPFAKAGVGVSGTKGSLERNKAQLVPLGVVAFGFALQQSIVLQTVISFSLELLLELLTVVEADAIPQPINSAKKPMERIYFILSFSQKHLFSYSYMMSSFN